MHTLLLFLGLGSVLDLVRVKVRVMVSVRLWCHILNKVSVTCVYQSGE